MMRSKSLWVRPVSSGGTIGSSGGGQPLPLVILTIIVLAMALITVFDNVLKSSGSVDMNKEIPFKCTSCGVIVKYTLKELQEMQKPGQMGPMMGPLILDCPQCKKHALTQAVECPKCSEIFIMKADFTSGKFDDKCPKCHESYSKAWQEKYRQENGE